MDITQSGGDPAAFARQKHQEHPVRNGISETDDQTKGQQDTSIVKMTTTNSVQDDITRMESLLAEKKSRGILDHFLRKKISIYFRDVNVCGPAPSWSFSQLFARCLSRKHTPQSAAPSHIIKSCDMVSHPGEMILVLGRPGSGCTTLLRTIANERINPLKVEGVRKYGGLCGSDFGKRFPRETSFSAASDTHIPSLTVEQTLQFAINLACTPVSEHEDATHNSRSEILDSLLALLGLTHTRDTLVGDARIRGVSGGERKRVSLAETLIARASVLCFDNPTLGLDAGSAIQFIRSLRVLTTTYESVAFVSLYQASDTLFDCFDKVILLEDGQELYFGPARSAVQHFEKLGDRKMAGETKSDFLTSCIDPRHRKTAEKEHTLSLRNAFLESTDGKRLQDDLDSLLQPDNLLYESARLDEISQDSQLSIWRRFVIQNFLFWKQVEALSKRHWLLKSQDRFNMFMKNATALIVALICGSSYWQLPRTSDGAFTRGGVMFIALLFTSFTAFVELPVTIMGRSVLYKQASLMFFRPSALPFGQLLIDIPLAALENLLFTLVIYFMAGLDRSAASFFTFYLFIVLGQTCMTVFFRTLGAVSRNLDLALRIACVIIILMVLSSGYLVSYPDQRPWLKWAYWLNPIHYAFAGMMVNEFSRLLMVCEGRQLIPNGPDYTEIEHKTCTIAGAVPGTNQVRGLPYLDQTFRFKYSEMWLNAGIMVIFIVGFLLLNFIFNELVSFETSAWSTRQNEASDNNETSEESGKASESTPVIAMAIPQNTLIWQSVNYVIPMHGKGTRQLLHNISGECRPGRILALMGPSGAGKSTLLDVLAKRRSVGTIIGNILLNGREFTALQRREIGYCEQLDTLDPHLTVRETLQFSALLRQPAETPTEEKQLYVEEVMGLLDLLRLGDVLVGESPNGLSVEERKRLSIGIELVARPGVLFLDEPTSGLDSQSALSILQFLRLLANRGQAIVCTIHQPSATLYDIFDDLLLLHHGRTVYRGPAKSIGSYLTNSGFVPPPNDNIAEFMIRSLIEKNENSMTAETWSQTFNGYSRKQLGGKEEHQIQQTTENSPTTGSYYPTSFMYQLRSVTWKTSKTLLRQPGYSETRIFNHIVIALLTGLAYLNIGDSLVDLQHRIFVIFQITILPSLVLSQVEPRFELSRTLLYKDDDSGMYSKTVFVASQILSEVPISIFCAVLVGTWIEEAFDTANFQQFYLLLYFPVNFSRNPSQAGYQLLVIYLTEQFSVLLGQAISALTPSSYTASLLTPFLLITFSLFCGVTIPPPSIPTFWKWLYRLNPLTYLVGGMIETEFHDRAVHCTTKELNIFEPPANQKCGEYAAKFLETSAGYLTNPNATVGCAFCPFSNAESYAAQFDLLWDHRWRDLGILAIYVLSTSLILFVAGTQINWRRR